MKASTSRGFTLVELLAVIAILGLLVTLTFPAITKVQANSRIRACQSNLRQIAISMSTYVDTRCGGKWPKDKGVKFLLRMVRDKEIEGNSLKTFTCPATDDVTYVDESDPTPGTGLKDFDNIDVNCISYAGRDNVNFPMHPDKSDIEVLAADDNDGRFNHRHLTNFVYMNGTTDSADIKNFRAELGEEAEWVPVGPDSPHPELRKLLID